MEIAVILGLILLNGLFAMAEIALVTARRARLQVLAQEGHAGAMVAVKLGEEPTRFLSTIQIGITSIGVLNGIVGEAALAQPFSLWMQALGADPCRVGGVVAGAPDVLARVDREPVCRFSRGLDAVDPARYRGAGTSGFHGNAGRHQPDAGRRVGRGGGVVAESFIGAVHPLRHRKPAMVTTVPFIGSSLTSAPLRPAAACHRAQPLLRLPEVGSPGPCRRACHRDR